MTLIIERGRVWTVEELPTKSLALDGAVQGPSIDTERQVYVCDHHDNCLRLVTKATCEQVLDMLLLGFNPAGFNVYTNDIDGDTALAVWLLQNPQRAQESRVRQLVAVVGGMDAHGPAYPTLDEAMCSEFYDRAMASERDARRNKSYGTCNLAALLNDCLGGITALVDNHAGKLKAPPELVQYTVTHGCLNNGKPKWAMVKSEQFVFGQLYKDGYIRAIAYRPLADGSYEYTVAKKSDLVDGFPVGPHTKPGTILHALATVEPGWGGGSSLGGAPRNPDGSRSKLTPLEVFNIVDQLLK